LPLTGTTLRVALPDLFVASLILAGFWLLLQAIGAYLPARMGTAVLSRLRIDTVTYFLRADWTLQSSEQEGHLLDVLTEQVVRAAQVILFLSSGLAGLFNFGALMVSAMLIDPVAALTIMVATVVLFFLLRPLSVLARKQAKLRSAASLDYSGVVSQAVRIVEEIQVFGVAEEERRQVVDVVDRIEGPWFQAQLLGGLVPAAYQGAAILLVLMGLVAVAEIGGSQFASLGAVILILFRALSYSQTLQNVYHSMNDTLPSMDLIADAQEKYRRHVLPSGGSALEQITSLAFDSVSFSYAPGRPVLRDISFEVEAGEAIGIVGPSGAGKSTLVQLLLRLRDPESGAYLVNGRSVAEISLASWREQVVYVPQEPRLLNATVAENIRFLRQGISDEAVRRAATLAQIHDDVMSLPIGYATRIGERAEAVSGGQRQRICLARALVGEPRVLVLDEPTSALDMRSESLVQLALQSLHGQVTMFIIAHRLSTLNVCDRIMVIQSGVLEAFAPMDVLIDTNPWYREAFDLSQHQHTSPEW
jgi:ABC-type multidrug transport system fused ATPase/permease subunit